MMNRTEAIDFARASARMAFDQAGEYADSIASFRDNLVDTLFDEKVSNSNKVDAYEAFEAEVLRLKGAALTAEIAAYFDEETTRDIEVINAELQALEEFIALAANTNMHFVNATARINALRAERAAIEPVGRAAAWIAEAKAWAMDHYENGADTLVECWDTSDYACLLATEGTEAAAWDMLKRMCSVWAERQADARSYREC